ncbi:Hypothetical_protein [Hexamita inflata]|uniref:Hypothetical_protein n=1 Tax=Hexamita inflata TaxID=28002 RepID=A0AA86TTD8_9EUKA|nr:Hypothetical protein HINF_LOCUS13817 [Hexamita inflata]
MLIYDEVIIISHIYIYHFLETAQTDFIETFFIEPSLAQFPETKENYQPQELLKSNLLRGYLLAEITLDCQSDSSKTKYNPIFTITQIWNTKLFQSKNLPLHIMQIQEEQISMSSLLQTSEITVQTCFNIYKQQQRPDLS